jgi:formylglycine-generating enzyme required for sulfatase activity
MASGEARIMRAPPGPLEAGGHAGQIWDGNSLRMPFCWCPPGKFKMGEAPDQVDVTLNRGFWLGKTEVTQAQWQSVMETRPWERQQHVKSGPDYPATFVNWDDARSFCEKLTKDEQAAGRLPEGWEYRLPTEAQWTYACRAGTTSVYSFGDETSRLGDYAWFDANAKNAGEEFAHEVALKLPNAWGLYDMHGNVWEWCRDGYAAKLTGGSDPKVAVPQTPRVLRGGSWAQDATYCRCDDRRGQRPPGYRFYNLAFRVAAVRVKEY